MKMRVVRSKKLKRRRQLFLVRIKMSCIISNDFAEIKEWMIIKGLAQEANLQCDIEGCDVYIQEYYGGCQGCENVSICDKADSKHESALVYHEGCKKTHFEGISVCLCCESKKSELYQCGCPLWYVDIFNTYEIHKQR